MQSPTTATVPAALVNGRQPCHRYPHSTGRPTMSTRQSAVVVLVTMAFVAGLASLATPADPIKIAVIDPFSGTFAATGESGLNQFRYAADAVNKSGGMLGRPIEIVPLDNK